jgi:hypothetical protein
MKIMLTLTAAVLTTAALSVPVSAGPIGCKAGEPINSSVKASDCRTWYSSRSARIAPALRSTAAFAYAPRSQTTIVRRTRSIGPTDNEGVKGGAAD